MASVATVQRRLNRLKRLGVVRQARARHDKRLVMFTLNPSAWKHYAGLGRMMRNIWGKKRISRGSARRA
ncbi:MAG: hypothetical protein A3H97_10305 [Acidobacteria bacterium RIFCSPLOWO2_02_FULL_65_29]|nr:MAG: hypothetical protein A3H97_10305 [Acidobacteria bacterium RIFCSPLOWO2_02_FULL_65_29]